MTSTTVQSYANHAYRPTQTAVAGLTGFVALVLFAYLAWREATLERLAEVLLVISVLTLVSISRAYTVRLQDRIIRLEMYGRLDRLGRRHDFGRLTTKQITALRFAPDAELPGLIDRALSENLTPDQIKRAVKDWQPDLLRT